MKISSNRDINKDRKKMPVIPPGDMPKIVIPSVQHDPPHNLKMLTERYNDEKPAITLLIVRSGLIAYHFLQKKMTLLFKILSGIFSSVFRATAFGGANFAFSILTDHGAKKRKRHDLAPAKLQRARHKWNENRMKRLDFISKRLRENNDAKAHINNIDEAMLEYY